jgi:uncharacterized delta-60 repeat protein
MKKLFPVVLAVVSFQLAPPAHAQDAWFPRTAGTNANLWGVAYGNNQWVAVGDPGIILTSPDGVVWTKRDSGFPTRWLVSVAYANGLFVVTGGTPPQAERQGIILTSSDGVTWTPRVNNATRVNNVTFGNGTWLAVDDLGGRWTSLDGLSWSFGSTARTGYLRGLAYGAPAFVSTGLTGIQSSYDGIGWSNRIPGAGQIEGLAYGRGRFVAVGTLGLAGVTYASRDGVTWTQQPTTTDLSARSIAFFNNQFILTGTATTAGGGLATSFDGVGWTPRPTGVPANTILLAVAAGPDSAIAVGTEGVILQSPASLTTPSIATQPSPVLEAVGGNVAFTVAARGSLPLAYQWRKDGMSLEGATTDTLFLPAVQLANSGNYSCVVTNAAGAAVSADAALNVVTTFPAAEPVDTTFTLGPSLSTTPRVAAAQADGKLILGGNFLLLNQGAAQFGLARLNIDGSLDTAFKPGTINSGGVVYSLAVQPDGKILVGGTFSSINGVTRDNLLRLNPDGSLDPSFTPVWGPIDLPPVTQVAPTRDGGVLAKSVGTLARYLADGTRDTAFATGVAVERFDQQADGKIVVAAFPTGNGPLTLVRFNSDGTADTTFTRISLETSSFTVPALRVLSDGRIIVAVAGIGFTVQRFSAAGLFDAAFTISANPIGTQPLAAFTSDGRTWLSGSFTNLNGVGRNQLARLNADGSVDATYNPGTGTGVAPSSLLALDDGRAVITGSFTRINTTPRSTVARLSAHSVGGANAPAIVNFAPLYREVPAGAPLTLPISASGSAQLTYAVFGSAFGQSGFTGGQVSIAPGLITTSGVIGINATNSVGSSGTQNLFVRVVPSAPFFIQQPAPLQTNVGRPLTLSTTTGGSSGISYQWFKDGAVIANATGPTYTVARSALADTGDYTVVARNALGFASSLTVHVGVDETARFINLATRGNVGRGDAALIVGFITAGPGNKRVMLRAVGPTIASAPFNVPGTLADPLLRVFNAAGALIYTNDDWGQANDVPGIGTADTRLGAFQLLGGSADAAGILTLAPGAYTAVISGKVVNGTETTGVALAEIYEDDTTAGRLVNLSSRGVVSPGTSVMIPAFVTGNLANPATTKRLLIRGVGPALTAFGVPNALANPTLSVVDSAGRTVATNDDWETNSNLAELRTVTATLAFPLAPGSKDSALLLTLPPGAYSCVVSGVNNTSGTALVEVYEVP